jgi:glycosyltransferase involved in cell wall biosynthesis
VFLEAAASGLPVIGGNRDGSVDALADGLIGTLVDPHQQVDLTEAICAALAGAAPKDKTSYQRFSVLNFGDHVNELVRSFH